MMLNRCTQGKRQSPLASASLFACVLVLLAACKPSTPATGGVNREAVEAARKALALQHPELLPRVQSSVPKTEVDKLNAKKELAALYSRLDAKLLSAKPNAAWSPPPATDMAITATARDAQIEKTGCTADFCRYVFTMHSEAPQEFAKRLGVEGSVLFRYSADATNTLTAYVFRPGADLQSL